MKIKSHPNEHQGIGPLFDKKWPDEEFDYADFDGDTYEPKFDATRLRGEMARVYAIMKSCWMRREWITLSEIAAITDDPEASISARLRDLRKAKFGAHTVNRRRRGDPPKGLFEYQLL